MDTTHWAVFIAYVTNMIFHSEEARQMWAKQEEKWNLEREAREKLMTEVLAIRQHQLEEKLEANLAEQRDLVKSREELVANVEQANAELQEERAALNKMKETQKKEIDIQVHSWYNTDFSVSVSLSPHHISNNLLNDADEIFGHDCYCTK
jgi:serine phosphatase RsbU (regulator of sigma subunit)